MNDFVKLKITFAVALLATAYTLNPLILKFSAFTISIFEIEITPEHAYFLFMAALGLSVYAFSIQLLSKKKYPSIDRMGNTLYSVAIITPALYIVLFLMVTLLTIILNNIPNATPESLNAFLSVSSSMVAVVFGFNAYKMSKRVSEFEKMKQEKVDEMNELANLSELRNNGLYDLAIIAAFKSIEKTLRTFIPETHQVPKNIDSLLEYAHEKRVLSNSLLNKIDKIRSLRNKVIHSDLHATKMDAEEAKDILQSLVKITEYGDFDSFSWVENNRDTILGALNRPISPEHEDIKHNLLSAWTKRDGAVGAELSVFFEVMIENNFELLLSMFEKDMQQYGYFIDNVRYLFFTDFAGEGYEILRDKRTRFLQIISPYLSECSNEVRRNMAIDFKRKIESVVIHEIV